MPERASPSIAACPTGASAALVLADGSVSWGAGLGAVGTATGELCFNTAMTGYQEIVTGSFVRGADHHVHFPTHWQRRGQ